MACQVASANCEKMQSSMDNKDIDLKNCRKLIKSYIDLVILCFQFCNVRINIILYINHLTCLQHLYSAALFWADKVVSLSNEDPKDICTLAHCMYLMKQYHRAAHLIRSRGLEKVKYKIRDY